MTYASPSFPPADDLLSALATAADHCRRIRWRSHCQTAVTVILTVAAFVHAVSVRLAPHVLHVINVAAHRVAAWSAVAEHHATVRALAAETATATTAPAPVRPVPAGTVAELRRLARAAGVRSIGGRPVKYATRAQLLGALA